MHLYWWLFYVFNFNVLLDLIQVCAVGQGLFTIALVKLPDSLQNSLCATFLPLLAGKVQLS